MNPCPKEAFWTKMYLRLMNTKITQFCFWRNPCFQKWWQCWWFLFQGAEVSAYCLVFTFCFTFSFLADLFFFFVDHMFIIVNINQKMCSKKWSYLKYFIGRFLLAIFTLCRRLWIFFSTRYKKWFHHKITFYWSLKSSWNKNIAARKTKVMP